MLCSRLKLSKTAQHSLTVFVFVLSALYVGCIPIWHPYLPPSFAGNFISYPYSGNTKYYIASFCRLEGYYLEDWVRYHLALGFDYIIICDNNRGDEDLEYIERVKSKFPNVEIINKRDLNIDQSKWNVEMYERVPPGDWCLFIDVDEFITFADNMSLYHYMSLVKQTPCQQIKINWMTFGNNKEIFLREGSVRDRFPKPMLPYNATVGTDIENSYVKAFIVGGIHLRFPQTHYAVARMHGCRSDFSKVSNHDLCTRIIYKYVYIRHYRTRSEQEYCMKMLRWKGDPLHDKDYKWKRYNSINVYAPNHIRTGVITDDCNVSDAYKHLLAKLKSYSDMHT